MKPVYSRQQTAETIREQNKLFDALNYKLSEAETDERLKAYFAEKAAKAAAREAKAKVLPSILPNDEVLP